MGISCSVRCITSSHAVDTSALATNGEPVPSLLPVLNLIWPQATTENVECRRMSGAMTNLVFKCDYKGHPNGMGTLPACSAPGSAPKHVDSVIVRIEGVPSFDRAMELKCFKTAARVGMGARLLVKFANGRVEECFKEHRAMEPADMTEPVASSKIAATLANFHTLMAEAMLPQVRQEDGRQQGDQGEGVGGWGIWDRMQHWAETVQQQGSTESLGMWVGLKDKVEQLQQILEASFPLWTTYGHNDLQCGNILVPCGEWRQQQQQQHKQQQQQEQQQWLEQQPPFQQAATNASMSQSRQAAREAHGVKLIDYDYCCWSTAGFDIANHWCEWAATYHPDNSFALDYVHNFPSPAQQRHFIAAYLKQLLRLHGVSVAPHPSPTSLVSSSVTSTAQSASAPPATPNRWLENAAEGSGSGPSVDLSTLEKAGGAPAQAEAVLGGFQRWVHQVLEGRQGSRSQKEGTMSSPKGEGGDKSRSAAAAGPSLHSCDTAGAQQASSLSPDQVESIIDELCAATQAWAAASHFHWGLWGLAQCNKSSIEFDYVLYAKQRLQQYEALVEHLIGGEQVAYMLTSDRQ